MFVKLLLLTFTVFAGDIIPSAVAIGTSIQSTTPITNFMRDIGQCTCDLTVNVCDSNCCCDADCSSADLLWFSGCSNVATSSPLPYCSQYLTTLEWSGLVQGKSYSALGGGLCVVSSNSPIKGTYFAPSAQFTIDSTFSAQFNVAQYTNSKSSYNLLAQVSNAYSSGSGISIYYQTLSAYGNFSLPLSNGGICSDYDYPRFMQSTRNTCSRYITSYALSCAAGSVFDIAYYTSSYTFLLDPSGGGIVLDPSLVTVILQCLDLATGLPYNCPLAGSSPIQLSNGRCSQMVSKIDYTFTYNSQSPFLLLAGVKIVVLFTTQVLTPASLMPQTFSTNYVASTTLSTYTRSGNPGYLLGYPVLAGLLTSGSSGAKSVNYIPDPLFGLTLPTDVPLASGQVGCTPGTSDYGSRTTVSFGENTSSGCTLYLKYSDLGNATACQNLRSTIYNLQTLTAANINAVGIFGNASVSNGISDWVSIIGSAPSAITGLGAVVIIY